MFKSLYQEFLLTVESDRKSELFDKLLELITKEPYRIDEFKSIMKTEKEKLYYGYTQRPSARPYKLTSRWDSILRK